VTRPDEAEVEALSARLDAATGLVAMLGDALRATGSDSEQTREALTMLDVWRQRDE